jgi:hypothetical protein
MTAFLEKRKPNFKGKWYNIKVNNSLLKLIYISYVNIY